MKCLVCNVEFKQNIHNQMTCSKECSDKKHRQQGKITARKLENRYKRAIYDSKSGRRKEFILTYEEYEELVSKPCYYCQYLIGKPVEVAIGLDRLNNKLGYTYENCVSCCDFCNTFRSNILTPEETKYLIQQLISYRCQKEEGDIPALLMERLDKTIGKDNYDPR